MLCLTFAAAAVALGMPRDIKEVTILHRRPSRIVDLLKPLLKETKLKPHDRRSVIELTGSKDQVEEAERAIRLFDIRPHMVSLDIALTSMYDKLETTYQVQIENNQRWEISLKTEGIRFSITPRVNDDTSITLLTEAKVPGWEGATVARVRWGEPLVLDFDRMVRERKDTDPTIILADTGIIVRIRPLLAKPAEPKTPPPLD
jgi:hypothetical protein